MQICTGDAHSFVFFCVFSDAEFVITVSCKLTLDSKKVKSNLDLPKQNCKYTPMKYWHWMRTGTGSYIWFRVYMLWHTPWIDIVRSAEAIYG